MKPEQFIREFGVEKAREVVEGHSKAYMPELFKYWSEELNDYVLAPRYASFLVEDLKRLVDSVELVNNCGGLAIANKITFQKRLRNEKATHFIQHPENQKLIQLLGRNQRKPKEAIKFDLFEQAIRDHESIYGGGDDL
ncbi:hypothetical protein ABH288_08255 [Acinetobacter pittii]|uniref:Uncharacterized protein n=1 Tax=Thermovibrio guaymasensis TaxID=240167 RepID=A0A420W5D6_9BACT|nr:hypothetical protein [Thermovibrio guaymasensis]RKQ59879.1 hypothetical protein C7457_1664 [Thermovibrio guaymasensis]